MYAGSWSIWFLIACCVAAVVLVIIAGLKVVFVAGAVMRHAKAVRPSELLLIKIDMAQEAGARIERTIDAAETLLPRAQNALMRINAAIKIFQTIVPGR